MKLEREEIQQWLEGRNQRESILIFLAGFAVVYLLWNVLFELPLQHQKKNIEQRSQELMTEVTREKQDLATVERVISSAAFSQSILKQHALSSQSNTLGKALTRLEGSFVSVESLAKVTNDVIAQQEEVVLISLKSLSSEPWLKDQVGLDSAFYDMREVTKHEMELEFQGSYFNVIAFLSHLEKLPWHIYWDKLNYQVLNYPDARVTARFYVLSKQKG